MSCQQPVCRDGIDDDGDGKNDYPEDPGCTGLDDNDEADGCPGVGPMCPACADGADNDTDTLTDWPADFACASASGATEAFCTPETNPTAVLSTRITTGTTVGMTNNFPSQTGAGGASCQSNASGLDLAYALVLPVPVVQLTLDTNSSPFDTILSVRDTSCATPLACDDDSGTPGTQSLITMMNVAAGAYAVIVDGYNGASGTFTLTVKGVVAAGTPCTSPLFSGGTNAILECPTGSTCTGSPAKCQ